MFLFLSLGILFLTLLLGMFFSAAETAITTLNNVDLEKLKARHKMSPSLLNALANPEQFLATMLIGNNIANISASSIVAIITEHYLGSVFVPVSAGILTLIIIIFCEIGPKQLALIYKLQITRLAIVPLNICNLLFKPLLNLIFRVLFLLFPALRQVKKRENIYEQLHYTISLASRKGFINYYEKDFILNILSLNDIVIRQIMIHRKDLFTVNAKTKIGELYPLLIEKFYSRVPVYGQAPEQIIGVLYLKDLLQTIRTAEQRGRRAEIEDKPAEAFIHKISFLPENTKVHELFFRLKETGGQSVIVLDEYGGLAGMASQTDIVRAVFGPIPNAAEPIPQDPQQIDVFDQYLEFNGGLTLQQWQQYLGKELGLPVSSRIATVAGYICERAGSIPPTGYCLDTPEGQYTVLESDHIRILKIRFIPAQPDLLPEPPTS